MSQCPFRGDGEFSFDEGVALLSRLETEGPAESLKFRAQVEMATEVAGHRYRLPDDRVAMRRRFRTENGARLDVCVSHLTDRPECIDDVAVRWLAAGAAPDYRAIARFRKRHLSALGHLFVQALALCQAAGMVRLVDCL